MTQIYTYQVKEVVKSEAIAFHAKKDLRDDKNFAEFYKYLQETYRIINDFAEPQREYDKKTGKLIKESIPTVLFARYYSTNSTAAFDAFKRSFDFSILNEPLSIIHRPNKNKFVLAAMKLFPNLEDSNLLTMVYQ